VLKQILAISFKSVDEQINERMQYALGHLPTLINLAILSLFSWGFHICWWCYCYCLISILFNIDICPYWYLILRELIFRDIGIYITPRLTSNNEFTGTMGRSQPWHLNSAFHCVCYIYFYDFHSVF
jgi:hypothetical protein